MLLCARNEIDTGGVHGERIGKINDLIMWNDTTKLNKKIFLGRNTYSTLHASCLSGLPTKLRTVLF